MTAETNALIQDLKEAGEDHEFYPTTREIIQRMIRDITYGVSDYRGHESVMDIGAGNGKVLIALKAAGFSGEMMAIEKSPILCQQLPDDVLIVGTVFEEQSLLSKRVDLVFCNPPYSQYEAWANKIIREASCKTAYLVIPERWQNCQAIKDALKYRDAAAKVLGEYSFENSEDRQARATVHLLKIRFNEDKDDAFDRFFKEQFKDLIGKFDGEDGNKKAKEEKKPFAGLVVGADYPETLVAMYQAEMAKISTNYDLVNKLDADLLREFDINPARIMECLKKRLEGLRSDYWNELFNHLTAVTSRLTSTSRRKMLDTLGRHLHVDFTVSNILAILVWVVKNANRYIDSQLIETYELMVDKCNVSLYKSNKRVWVDERWRYNGEPEKNSHYALDYRIVTHRVGGFDTSYSWRVGLDENAANFIGDLMTLANNLGFDADEEERHCLNHHNRDHWTAGKGVVFHFTKNGKTEELFDVKAHKNRNLHLRLNQAFILALNVEHGRLKGWINTPREAVEELQDEKAAQYFGHNRQLCATDTRPLLKAG